MIVCDIPFIKIWEVDGAIIATALGYGVSIAINIWVINRVTEYKSKVVVRRILLICMLTVVMAIVVWLTHKGLYMIAPADSKLLALVYSFVCAGIGAAVYGALSFKLGLAQMLLGDKLQKITRKLGFK